MNRHLLLSTLVAFSIVNAKTYNSIDNDYSSKDVEQGYHFYNEKKTEEPIEINKKDSKESKLLATLITEIRKNKNELKKLNFYTNPNAPHKIKCSDGTIDYANSRAECFEMPMITEARNMPALSNFMQNPTPETAAVWLGVQAKVFNRAMKMGFSLKFAYLNGDEDVYPVTTVHTDPTIGSINASKNYLHKKHLLKKYSNALGTVIFLGETTELEKNLGPEKIGRLLYSDEEIFNPLLIFKNKETKDAYDAYFTVNYLNTPIKNAYLKAEKQIIPEMFDSYNVRISPTIMAVFKKSENEVIKTVITKGFMFKEEVISGILQFLVLNDIMKPEEINYIDKWRIAHDK